MSERGAKGRKNENARPRWRKEEEKEEKDLRARARSPGERRWRWLSHTAVQMWKKVAAWKRGLDRCVIISYGQRAIDGRTRLIQPSRNVPGQYRYVASLAKWTVCLSIDGDLERKRDESVPVGKRNPNRSTWLPMLVVGRFIRQKCHNSIVNGDVVWRSLISRNRCTVYVCMVRKKT